MASLKFILNYRPFLPWICSSLALGYAAYITWKLKRVQDDNKKRPMNIDQDNFPSKHEVNIDTIDRNCQVESEDSASATCCSEQKSDGCCNDDAENGSLVQFPQCRRTAFGLFLNECNKKSNQNGNIQNQAKFAKDCAQKWKELSSEEKAFFHKLSKEDKSRYEREVQEYKKQLESQKDISECSLIVEQSVESITEIKADDLVNENTVNLQSENVESLQNTLDFSEKLDYVENDTLNLLDGIEETINNSIEALSFADNLNAVEQISQKELSAPITPSVLTINDEKEFIPESLNEMLELPVISNEQAPAKEQLSQTLKEDFFENDESTLPPSTIESSTQENTYRPFSGDNENLDDIAFDLFCTDEMPKVRAKFNPLQRRMSGEEMLDELLERWDKLPSDLKKDYFHKAMQSL